MENGLQATAELNTQEYHIVDRIEVWSVTDCWVAYDPSQGDRRLSLFCFVVDG